MAQRDLLGDGNVSWADWLQTITEHVAGGASRRFGSVRAVSAGVPIPLFNQAYVFEPPEVDDLTAAVTWMQERKVPFWATVPATLVDDVTPTAEEAGLTLGSGSMPGMAIMLDALSERPQVDAEIVVATDASQLEEAATVMAEAFSAPVAAAKVLVPASMLDDERITWFVARAGDETVACGQLQHTGDVAGVYAIAVREAHRRRGLGEAISWAVLDAGRRAGCEAGVLQASEMGRPVYERMGFHEVVRYHQFVPAD